GALPVLILTMLYFVSRKVLTFKEVADCIPQGVNTMVPAILILTLATALKNMTTQLQAMEFIARTIDGSAANFVNFLPAVIFLVAVGLSFSTGTAWGTFGILIPIVIGIFPSDNPLFIIDISACLAGAVCGDHCSPISDTTIMASAGSGCKHIVHVSTQLPYALTVAAFSFAGFVLSGFIQNWFVIFPILVFSMICLLLMFKFFAMPRREEF
ncbi:MAG: Na+/H+ antiporter NhaC family protein, partial [Lentisphaeria bacterium]|nr:Na+/H+ antiporter NhaC family protein [Lentisphaeria bacterium]